MNKEQMENEIEALKKEIKEFQQRVPGEMPPSTASVETLLKYLIDEREKTNRILGEVIQKIKILEGAVATMNVNESREEHPFEKINQLDLSSVDAKIINFVQMSLDGMACADEVKKFMNYKGNNAACARLNRLRTLGLLERHQLGHKVYYKFDAGKATNTLIVSPPQ